MSNSDVAPQMWILAYDEGCAGCRGVAGAVTQASDGLLEVASLRDPRVIDALRRAGRSANRPTLVDSAAGDVLQGSALGWRMARLIGLRRALQVLHLIGEERQRSSHPAGPTRRGILATGGKVALGALIAGGALTNSATAQAATPKGSGPDLRGLRGPELANAVREAVADPTVVRLAHELQKSGYGDYDQVSSTAVAASDPHGKTVTWLPLWHAQTSTLAIIVVRSWRPAEPRVMLLQEVNGKVGPAPTAPAANNTVVMPALDWSCLSECVSMICPTCSLVCAFAGPAWPVCIIECCGYGVLACYTWLC